MKESGVNINVQGRLENQAKLVFLSFNEEEEKDFMDMLREIVHQYDKNYGLPLDKLAEVNVTYRTPGDKQYFYCTIYLKANSPLDVEAIVVQMLEKTKQEYAELVENEKVQGGTKPM